jgi:hypothetical protein
MTHYRLTIHAGQFQTIDVRADAYEVEDLADSNVQLNFCNDDGDIVLEARVAFNHSFTVQVIE